MSSFMVGILIGGLLGVLIGFFLGALMASAAKPPPEKLRIVPEYIEGRSDFIAANTSGSEL